MKIVAVVIVAAVLAVGGTLLWAFADRSQPTPRHKHADDVEKLFGGPDGFATLKSPDRIEAFRIEDDRQTGQPHVISKPIVVAKPLATELTAILSSPDSYGWDYAKFCELQLGVQLSFYRGDDRLDVLLCFQCDELQVRWKDARSEAEDFDAIRPPLVRAVKALFPDDAVIQGLKEGDGSRPGVSAIHHPSFIVHHSAALIRSFTPGTTRSAFW